MRGLTPGLTPVLLPPDGPTGPFVPPPPVEEVGLVLSGTLQSMVCVSSSVNVRGTRTQGASYNLLALRVVAVGLPVQPAQSKPRDLRVAVAVVVLTVHAEASQ